MSELLPTIVKETIGANAKIESWSWSWPVEEDNDYYSDGLYHYKHSQYQTLEVTLDSGLSFTFEKDIYTGLILLVEESKK